MVTIEQRYSLPMKEGVGEGASLPLPEGAPNCAGLLPGGGVRRRAFFAWRMRTQRTKGLQPPSACEGIEGGPGLRRQDRRAGFTLLELLVVIAIIALLMAILFPVFAAIRENGRQTTTIANMHDISAKLAEYDLDNHHYPPVLFGYAVPTTPTATTYVPMDKAYTECTSNPGTEPCSTYFPGLYPEYINNLAEFQDPNDDADPSIVENPGQFFLCSGNGNSSDDSNCFAGSSADVTQGALVVASGKEEATYGGANIVIPTHIYAADSFDASPQVLSNDQIDPTNGPWIARYQTSWTAIAESTLDCSPPSQTSPMAHNGANLPAYNEDLCPGVNNYYNFYLNQLRWRNPPGGAFVTASTWHVNQTGQVIVLENDGTVRKIDTRTFALGEVQGPLTVDSAGVGSFTPTGGGVTPVGFWKITR